MNRLAIVALLSLLACGPDLRPPNPTPPTKVVSRAMITNEYAVSLFRLVVALPGHSEIVLFANERIESGKTATSPTFDVPLGGSDVNFQLVGTSLGDQHAFTGTKRLEAGAERLIIEYDYDLATGRFRVLYGSRAD